MALILIIAAMTDLYFRVQRSLDHLEATTEHVRHASHEGALASSRVNRFVTDERLKNLENYFYLTTDQAFVMTNHYGTVAKATADWMYSTKKRTDALLDHFESKTLVRIDRLVEELTSAIKVAAAEEGVLDQMHDAIEALEALLRNPNLIAAIANVEATTASVKLAAQDFLQGLPVLIAAFQAIARNGERITESSVKLVDYGQQLGEQLVIAAKKFNQPLTGAQRILAFLASALGKSLPTLIGR
ncbi:MAG: hypothetical protein AB1489_12110 [Acidobacteriota bacterium]